MKLFFEAKALRGTDRDNWDKFKETLRESQNPRDFSIAVCPSDKSKLILQITNTNHFLAINLHDKENPHPEIGKCIILIQIAKLDEFVE